MTIFLQEQILKFLPASPGPHKQALSMCCTGQHRRILEVLAVLIPNPKCTAFLVSDLPNFTVLMKENQQMRLLHQSLARQGLALRKRPHDLHCKTGQELFKKVDCFELPFKHSVFWRFGVVSWTLLKVIHLELCRFKGCEKHFLHSTVDKWFFGAHSQHWQFGLKAKLRWISERHGQWPVREQFSLGAGWTPTDADGALSKTYDLWLSCRSSRSNMVCAENLQKIISNLAQAGSVDFTIRAFAKFRLIPL